ncbi:hypothetical protein [Kitasatospora purpeofusca]|uniref:hypothetical protein n=1 Tax=Kitasatospora purpeofusca TaxID=67352 RepID=UPI00224CD656|nr:hypothetical protein [Kitasatospora purpeofusca]MCX4752875.1 hypothetical protein [Kitasatospora purpeofusca]
MPDIPRARPPPGPWRRRLRPTAAAAPAPAGVAGRAGRQTASFPLVTASLAMASWWRMTSAMMKLRNF